MAEIEKRYDLVIYGATGFTGKFIARYCAQRLVVSQRKFSVAISGRTKSKLEDLRADISKRYQGADFSELPILVADLKDTDALKTVAMSAKVLINATGPYRLYGDNVVAACVEGGCHYVDICGEPEWIEKTAVRFYEKAREKGLFIVSSCGFDSVPSELGMLMVAKHFRKRKAQLSCIDEYIKHTGPSVPTNATTWRALVDSYGSRESLKEVRQNVESQSWRTARKMLKRVGPKYRPLRGSYWWDDKVNSYATLYTFADNAVIAHSQGMRSALLQKQTGEEHTFPQYGIYLVLANSYWGLLPFIGMGMNINMFTGSNWGRNFLKSKPEMCSMGIFTDDVFGKSSEEELSKAGFEITMFAKGYSEEKKYQDDFDEFATATISGPDCGYNATSALVVESGLQLLWNLDAIKKGDIANLAPELEGGCFTPSTVFAATDLVDVLNDGGLFKFSVESIASDKTEEKQ